MGKPCGLGKATSASAGVGQSGEGTAGDLSCRSGAGGECTQSPSRLWPPESPPALFAITRMGRQHGPPCQQTRPVNRRKRRIGQRNVGLQRGPWGFVLDSRQPESPTGENRTAKYSRNVEDNGGARKGCCQRKRRGNSGQRDGGSPAWIRTTIHGSKGRCPTIRRPGNARETGALHSVTAPTAPRNESATIALEAILGRCRVRASNPLCGTLCRGWVRLPLASATLPYNPRLTVSPSCGNIQS